MAEWSTLLSGIVGSTAYGLNGPDSDVDRLGFAAAPTVAFHGLHIPTGKAATREQHKPDVVVHEAGKYLSLALACNPTILELLYLPDELIEVRTPLGDELIAMRRSLLSARRVRDAYLGYAESQFRRLRTRGRFPDVPVSRIRKHARHLRRLVFQGRELYLTGEMNVEVTYPHLYHAFAERIVSDPERGLEVAERLISTTAMALDSRKSALPEHPDEVAAERWLRKVRAHHYQPEEGQA